MKRAFNVVFAAVTLAIAGAAWSAEPAASEGDSKTASADEAVSSAPPAQPVYRPPAIGKPAHTVGGGSRGTPGKIPALYVVAPDHVGQTTSAEPSLFWYIDRAPDPSVRVEFTVLGEEGIEPIVEAVLPTPTEAGIHRIRLADHGAKLEAGTEYEWSVALVIDPDERSKDIVATGFIDRVDGSDSLASRLASADKAGSAAVYADEGIWYDAIAALSDQIERNPGDADLLRQRADLLRQVGLDEAAAGPSK